MTSEYLNTRKHIYCSFVAFFVVFCILHLLGLSPAFSSPAIQQYIDLFVEMS